MQIDISPYNMFLILAGEANTLARYIVSGNQLKEAFSQFSRIPYVGVLEGFECYTKNPDTGEGGWDIVWIEGVKEKIEQLYPNFDCFITKDYPSGGNDVVKFYATYGDDDFEMKVFTSQCDDHMTESRIDHLLEVLIDDDVNKTVDYIISKDPSKSKDDLFELVAKKVVTTA